MATKRFPDDETNNRTDRSDHSRQEQDLPNSFSENKPAFTFSNDDELDAVRKAMIETEANKFIANSPPAGNSSEKINSPTNQTHPEFEEWLSNLEKTNDDTNSPFVNPNETSGQFFSAFDEEDFNIPENKKTGFEIPQDQDMSAPESSLTMGASDLDNSENDEFSQRINSVRYDTEQNFSTNIPITPPFVMDDILDLNENNNSLPKKIINGLVPAETIELLITSTMSEDEVISVTRELGIDWTLIPETTRVKKIRFLVEYFKNKDIESELVEPQFLTQKTEEDWRESDSRLKALQESFILPEPASTSTKKSFFNHSEEEGSQTSSLVKGLIIGLSILILVLIITVSYFVFLNKPSNPIPTATPISTNIPIPASIQLPGGWAFDLNIGSIQEGNWKPSDAEWLTGTEICRVVSLPWNKQIEAVFQTFTAGDNIFLAMNNKDVLTYEIESVSKIKIAELNPLINRTSPSMIVVLTQLDADDRLVIVSKLVKTAPAPTPSSETP